MTVIVSYTPTPEGRAALDFAIEVARLRSQKLVVVDGSGGRHHLNQDKGQVPYADVEELLAASEVEYVNLPPAETGHNQHEVVLEQVNDETHDIVVVGVRRRNPISQILFGSSTQRIIEDADCPVYVIKAPLD